MKQLLNTLYVTTPNAYLRLDGETVCIMVDKQKRLQVPLHHLSAFVLFDHVMLSPALLGRCAADGRSIIWLNRSGRFMARMEGPVNGNILLRKAQFKASEEAQQCLQLACSFIAGKIRNSRQLLMRAARDCKNQHDKDSLQQASSLLAGNLKKLQQLDNLDALRGIEGDSAHLYFAALPNAIPVGENNIFFPHPDTKTT